jgi:hypothetical protein
MRSAISPATWTFDQFALASFSEDHKEGRRGAPRPAEAEVQGTLKPRRRT